MGTGREVKGKNKPASVSGNLVGSMSPGGARRGAPWLWVFKQSMKTITSFCKMGKDLLQICLGSSRTPAGTFSLPRLGKRENGTSCTRLARKRQALRSSLLPGYSGTGKPFPVVGFIIEMRTFSFEDFNHQ